MDLRSAETPRRHFTTAGARNLLVFVFGLSVAAGLFWSWFVDRTTIADGVAWALLVSGAALFGTGGYHLGPGHRSSAFFDEIESVLGQSAKLGTTSPPQAAWAWLAAGALVYVLAALGLLLR